MDWQDVRAFREVALKGTVREASRSLKVHHSTLSRRIIRLEETLNTKLFDRTHDGYVLTSAGEHLFEVAKKVGENLLGAERKLSGHENILTGTIRVSLSPIMAEYVFAAHLNEFAELYPDIDLHFLTGPENIAVSGGDADIAIRADNNPPEVLMGKCLFPYYQTAYASKEYLALHDLQQAPESCKWINSHEDDVMMSNRLKPKEFTRVPSWGCFSDVSVQKALAIQGTGLAYLPCMVGDADKRLARATSTPPLKSKDIWILTQRVTQKTAKVRAFLKFAENVIQSNKATITGEI